MAVSYSRVWSLLDMLERFKARAVLSALNFMAQTERLLRSDLDLWGQQLLPGYDFDSGEQRATLLAHLANLKAETEQYGLAGTDAAISALQGALQEPRNYAALDNNQVRRIHTLILTTHATVIHVLSDTAIYVLTRGSADYVSGSKCSFGEDVDAAFPSAVYDTHEASKCLGLERWTACVMHCMRALEPGLQALEDAVNVEVPKEQWGDKINQIESAIKKMNKGTHPKADVQWFSEAAAQFHFMKNAWRNYAQHLLHTYDEDRATEIYDATRRFMRHLSKRLSEPA